MPLEFQTALTFTPEEGDPSGISKISKMCIRMKEMWEGKWKGEKPSTVETLPLRYSLDNLLKQVTLPQVRHIYAVVGIDDRTLGPALIDIERQGPHMVVIGQPFSGKTTTLRTIMLSVAANYSPDEIMMVLIDFSRKLWKAGQTSLANIPHVVQTIDDIAQLDDFLENMKIECAEFDTKPRRRKIMIIIDDYDGFTEEAGRKKASFFENLSMLIRKYQTAGVFLIVAGSLGIMSSSDDLRKVFAAPNFGIALRSADAVNRLNGKFPRSLADAELPMGRAFTVRSGITSMLQIATPYANDEDVEGSLDLWVNRIKEIYSKKNVSWLSGGKDGKSSGQSEPENPPAASAAPNLSQYNIPDLKKRLMEAGLPDSVINLFGDSDIIENARAMGLLDAKAEEKKEDKPKAKGKKTAG
jgi:hypothetical protein